jgi:hypothetical protein
MTVDYFMLAVGSLVVGLFVGTLLLLEVGRRLGLRQRAREGEGVQAGVGQLQAAVFGLLGLLIAFTFGSAVSRFATRQQMVVEEANAIGTAYLRLDLLSPTRQPTLRDSFRRYVDSRLAVYRRLPDLDAARAELGRSTALQSEIWTQAVAACRLADSQPSACVLLIPALNHMIDITTTRTAATQIHPPAIIFVMLFGMALASALLAGYNLAVVPARNWLHMLGFASMIAIAVYVILDIEYPRLGLIRIDAIDQVLIELRAGMK